MNIVWIVLAIILLYVVKTLYDLNAHRDDEEDIPTHTSLKKDVRQQLFVSQQKLEPISTEESFKKADMYEVTEEEDDGYHSSSETSLTQLVVKELIPETEHIDIDCFIYFKGARLLVVEDNRLNQKIIHNVLKQSGIEIDIADNGQIALDYLLKEKREYDMVLMDISMPVMDGITTTKIIRRFSRFERLPIVTFTAFSLGEEIDAMFKAGANAYLTKPLNIRQLYTVFMLFIGNVNRGLSPEKMYEIQGLNIEEGLENFQDDIQSYMKALEAFVRRFRSAVDQVPEWIEEKRYDRVRLECKVMLPILSEIGAYEMHHMVQEVQLQFVYRNEHLLGKYKLLFRTTLQALIDTIEVYLDSSNRVPA